jgi:hypothetical protein
MGDLGGFNPLKYTDPSGYEVYPGPAWWDSNISAFRYLDAYNQMHIISRGEAEAINARQMAAEHGTLRYATSEYDEMKRYLSDGPGLVSAFDEYCGKLDYIQRYGSDLYKAAKESGAVTSQSYTEFLTNTLLKADFSSGFLKIANYVQVYGFIGGIVNKDGKLYGKSLIGGAMAAHISDTYIKVPGQSAGQGSGEGSGLETANNIANGLGMTNDVQNLIIDAAVAGRRGMSMLNVNSVSYIRTGKDIATYMKYAKGLGTAGAVLTTGYSVNQVSQQLNNGVNIFEHRAIYDASVGIVGLAPVALGLVGVTVGAPVVAVIGIGVLTYSVGTTVWDGLHK